MRSAGITNTQLEATCSDRNIKMRAFEISRHAKLETVATQLVGNDIVVLIAINNETWS